MITQSVKIYYNELMKYKDEYSHKYDYYEYKKIVTPIEELMDLIKKKEQFYENHMLLEFRNILFKNISI